MITVKEWMELVDYRITEGSDYGWQCFGSDAYSLSSWNGDHDGWSFNIVFDNKTQEVYTVEVCDYARNRAYRIINPDYKQAHDEEANDRGVSAKEAWDECDYVDLEADDDFIQKSLAIRDGVDYDVRVSVPLELPDDVLFELMKRAHEQDITLNQMVEEILWVAIREEEARRLEDDEFSIDDRSVLDSQYPDGDGYWKEDEMRDEYDFSDGEQGPVEQSLKKLKKNKDSGSIKKSKKRSK